MEGTPPSFLSSRGGRAGEIGGGPAGPDPGLVPGSYVGVVLPLPLAIGVDVASLCDNRSIVDGGKISYFLQISIIFLALSYSVRLDAY
jgi:hypothetical protein